MRAIKKIVALATGAAMLGATVMGAMAADLADYPSPLFIEDGKFDGSIVVGDLAAAEDVVGAIDIATSLQYSATTVAADSGTETEVTVEGEAYKVERSTNRLNLGEDIADVATKIDDGDLPTVLADGVYTNDESNDYDYEQTIDLTSATFTAISDKDLNDEDPTIGVQYEKTAGVLVYDLTFTTDAESDVDDGNLDDFEDTTIDILGNTYDIVESTNQSGGYFELMGGAVKDTLEQGETKTYTVSGSEYEVTVTYIGGLTTSEVKFQVNDEVTDSMVEGDTYKMADGTQLGVREILEEEAGEVTADMVEFYIGAEKLTFENGEEMQMNDEDVDDITVTIDSSQDSDEYTWNELTLTWTADDEFFVTDELEAPMPGLESVKLSFEGFMTPAEEIIEIDAEDELTISITAPIYGDEDGYEFALLHDMGDESMANWSGFQFIGEDNETLLLTTDAFNYDWDSDTDDMMVISNSDSWETHFLEVSDIDDEDGVDFEDVVTGATYDKKGLNETFEVADMTFTVQSFSETLSTVRINTSSADFEGDALYTLEGLKLTLPTAVANVSTYDLVFEEEADDSDIDGQFFQVTVESNYSADTDAGVDSTNLTKIHEVGDTDVDVYYLLAGEVNTKLELDRGNTDQYTAKIFYPGGESYGNMYVAEIETGFGRGTVTGGVTVIEKIEVGTAKLASEIANVAAQNLLLVGGPCANKAASDVMGFTAFPDPDCAADFEEGKAKIKLYDTGSGNVAMLVAGYSAADTRRASKVIAEYDKYALSGSEMEVTGTSMTDITVTSVE